jgi:hypothetical protein
MTTPMTNNSQNPLTTLTNATLTNAGADAMIANIPNPSQPRPTHRRQVKVAAAVALIPLLTLLAACGNSSAAPAAQATNPAPTQAQNRAPGSGGQGGTGAFPGVSGLIAAASPGTLQVQSTTAQNTVVYTAATTFTKVTPGHVAAGDCVIVTGTPVAGSTQGLTATSVRIVAKVNGACPTAGTGPGGAGGRGAFPQRPSGTPSNGVGQRRAFASATGTVSSVAGSTILLQGVLRNGQSAPDNATPPAPTAITVTLGASTTVTQTVPATSAAAVVGQCASAIGTANSTGTITARSITVSSPGPNGCQSGFGGRFNGNGGTGTGSRGGTNA